MANTNSKIEMIRLDEKQRRRFRENAIAALSRRAHSFMMPEYIKTAELFTVAIVAFLGVFVWGWSAPAMVVFFLANIWMGWLTDLGKYVLVRHAVERFAESHNNDQHAWAVAGAMMESKTEFRADSAGGYVPGTGIAMDLLFGGVATALIVLSMMYFGFDLLQPFRDDPWMRLTMFATLVLQALSAATQIVPHIGARAGTAPIRFAAGARGIGMFLLMFVYVFIGMHNPKWFVIAANGCLILLGVMSIGGLFLMHKENVWLRKYIADETAAGRPLPQPKAHAE